MPFLLFAPNNTLSVGRAGFSLNELIKHFEGYKLTVYADSAGLATVGYGHLVRPKDNLKLGDKITKEQAEKFLEQDLEDARLRVAKAIMGKDIILTENEFETLVSLAYNLRSFEQLVKHLPDRKLFLNKMLLYCRDVEKNWLKGLKIRRIAERLLFEGKDWLSVTLELQGKTKDEIQNKEKELFS